uniref:Mediator of RNA polymerase II transcription subunit 31 n=1 Tax=Globisporangium ultimum (strain ATCC 200006 / CBS 805.95 / DAOM BR144) TaxID=431595 RepID=K3WGM9_GLOUD
MAANAHASAGVAAASSSAALPSVDVPSNNIRFQIELEFIQCLASPAYLNYLAINRYFDNPAFLNYLQYLKYWKQPQYAKYIVYPHALAFLDMLDDERFRQMIQREDFMTLVHSQQFYHWQTFLNNRMEVKVKDEDAAPSSS